MKFCELQKNKLNNEQFNFKSCPLQSWDKNKGRQLNLLFLGYLKTDICGLRGEDGVE
jgi:hypothetical protein